MDYFLFAAIGILMGLFGGLLGIGGSIIMIPALVFAFGENQHLYQASAMICNFFVGASAAFAHKEANFLMKDVIKWLVPAASLGIIAGVALSNTYLFAGRNSYILARMFGFFMIYVIFYYCLQFRKSTAQQDNPGICGVRMSAPLIFLCGLVSGIPAGLLGIGGGLVCTPLQQLLLKMPMKRAIGNSAVTIAAIAIIGAFYKNVTLQQHSIVLIESVKIAIFVTPGAIAGGFLGGRLMYKLPENLIRVIFIVVCVLACYKLFTVSSQLP